MVVFPTSGAFIHDHAKIRRSTREDGVNNFAVALRYAFTIFCEICRRVFTKDFLNGSHC